MGCRWGLIEWIDNLNPLKGIVSDYWEAAGKLSVTVSYHMIVFYLFNSDFNHKSRLSLKS
jgi:hypothetical protein